MDHSKIILTGATGFIGSEVLKQCLAHPSVTSVVALSRRPLPEPIAKHPKLEVIIHEDFSSYSSTLLKNLAGATACIWAMGLLGSKAESADAARRVNLEYTVTAATTFKESLQAGHWTKDGSSFRFLYLSGNMAVRDQHSSPWFLADSRRMRGEVENRLIEIGQSQSTTEGIVEHDEFRTFIFRPSLVLAKESKLSSALLNATFPSASINVDDLAAVMVNVAVEGSDAQTMDPTSIKTRAKALESSSS